MWCNNINTLKTLLRKRQNYFWKSCTVLGKRLTKGEVQLFFHDPNVTKLQRVSVTLQFYGTWGSFRVGSGPACFSGDGKIFVNHDSIESGGNSCILNFFSFFGLCVGKFNVISLPGKRRTACVDQRVFD